MAPLSRDAACQHRLVHVVAVHASPAERREEGGVHVQDAIAVAGDDDGGNELEVAGQDQEVHPVARQPLEPVLPVGGVGQHLDRHTVRAGTLQGPRIGSIAHDQHHPRRGLGSQCTQQRLEVAAAPRDGHGHAHRHGRGN